MAQKLGGIKQKKWSWGAAMNNTFSFVFSPQASKPRISFNINFWNLVYWTRKPIVSWCNNQFMSSFPSGGEQKSQTASCITFKSRERESSCKLWLIAGYQSWIVLDCVLLEKFLLPLISYFIIFYSTMLRCG